MDIVPGMDKELIKQAYKLGYRQGSMQKRADYPKMDPNALTRYRSKGEDGDPDIAYPLTQTDYLDLYAGLYSHERTKSNSRLSNNDYSDLYNLIDDFYWTGRHDGGEQSARDKKKNRLRLIGTALLGLASGTLLGHGLTRFSSKKASDPTTVVSS